MSFVHFALSTRIQSAERWSFLAPPPMSLSDFDEALPPMPTKTPTLDAASDPEFATTSTQCLLVRGQRQVKPRNRDRRPEYRPLIDEASFHCLPYTLSLDFLFSSLLFPECVYRVFLLGLDLDPDPDLNTARAEDLDKNDDDCSPGRMELKVRLTAAAGRSCEVGSHDPRRTLDPHPEDEKKLKLDKTSGLDTAPASLKLTEGLDDPVMSASPTLPRSPVAMTGAGHPGCRPPSERGWGPSGARPRTCP
ncbi:hypothetical protein VTO73DRAFT_4172 [Trametes versicolor]